MAQFFLFLFRFFKKRRGLFLILLLLSFTAAVLLASHIHLEEDITKVMPLDKKTEKANLVFRNSKLADRLVVTVTLADTTAAPQPDLLVQYADSLTTHLKERLVPSHIKELTYVVDDGRMRAVNDIIYQHLPVFLEETDYTEIEELLTDAGIAEALERDYKALISPAGMALKENIVRDPLGLTNIVLSKLQTLRLDDNYELYNDRILTQDKGHLLFFITPAHPTSETALNGELLDGLDELMKNLSAGELSAVSGEYFGGPAVAVGNARQLKRDIMITVSIAVVVLLLFISLFFRRKAVFFIIFLPAVFGGLAAVALMAVIHGSVSAIALGVGSILLGISVDSALHIFTHYKSRRDVEAVIVDLTTSVVMSALTTAAAFLCLLFVKSEALHDLGLFAAFSVVSAAVFSLIVLPQYLDLTEGNKEKEAGGFTFFRFVDKLSLYPLDRKGGLLAALVLLTIVFFFTARQVSFEGDMDSMNFMTDKLKEAESNLSKINTHVLKTVYVIAQGKDLEGAVENSEEILEHIGRLKQEGVIRRYSGVNTLLLSRARQEERIAQWKSFWSEERRSSLSERISQAGLKYNFKPELFERYDDWIGGAFARLDDKEQQQLRELFYNDYVTQTDSSTTIISMAKVREEDKEVVYERLEGHSGVTIFDKKHLTTKLVENIRLDFQLLINLSLAVVFLILLISYGRIELALLTYIPMLISWVWTLGIMGAAGIQFNIINIIVSTFVFGLGIDYCIFVMQGLKQEYTYGRNNLPAYKTSIFLSAFTTIVGIGVLIFAEHPALKSIALISVVGISSVMLVAFTIEPFLFRQLIGKRAAKGKLPHTFQSFVFAWSAFIFFATVSLIIAFLGAILMAIPFLSRSKKDYLLHRMMQAGSWQVVYGSVNIPKKIINPRKEDFSRPAVVIANHSSFLDIILMLMLHPKMVMLTNDWVWNSPIFGKIVQMAGFYPVTAGYGNSIDKLSEKVKQGYSIVVFPEGTRSPDGKPRRFHKGAFYLAEQLDIEILPVIIHGAGYTNPKSDFMFKNRPVTLKFLDRITPDDKSFGDGYTERTKQISRYFKKEFKKLKRKEETPAYFLEELRKNYLYKGPTLEWYQRIKTKLEGNYGLYHELLPKKGDIVDIGCGYGFMTYMLHFLAEERRLLGIDYDEEKIELASHCVSKSESVQFICADVSAYELPFADAFVLSDVLHYLSPGDQRLLIERCIEKLRSGGMLLIRDANTELEDKHFGTRLTEFFSTRFGFNKTKAEGLHFLSATDVRQVVEKFALEMEVMDQTRYTSNVMYVIRKNQ